MKRIAFSLLLSLAFTATAFASDATPALIGTWSGMLAFPKGSLLFVITFANDGGKLSATASSPYQGGGAMPVDSLSIDGGKLTFAIRKLGITYAGTTADNAVSGTFTQNGTKVPLVLSPSAIGTKDLAGTWLGTLTTAGGSLLLGLHVQDGASGALTATLDSPYQGTFGFPVTSVASLNGTFTFAFSKLNASFSGKIGNQTITGTFTQNGQKFPLTLARP